MNLMAFDLFKRYDVNKVPFLVNKLERFGSLILITAATAVLYWLIGFLITYYAFTGSWKLRFYEGSDPLLVS